MSHIPVITVKKSPRLAQGSPWIYSNEILEKPDNLESQKAIVIYQTTDRKIKGFATYNKNALISLRVLTRDIETPISQEWFYEKAVIALEHRERYYPGGYYRWIYGESDELPGLVIDRYLSVAVVEINSAGMDLLYPIWIEAFKKGFPEIQTWVIRRDSGSRVLENISQNEPEIVGKPLEDLSLCQEGPISFYANFLHGQKTGWFYDQRDNRQTIAQLITPDMKCLDLCTHTGSFALYMAAYGAKEVVAVDISYSALEIAQKNAALNGLSHKIQWVKSDLFDFLNAQLPYSIDCIVLDPPAFIKGKKSLQSGLAGYLKALVLSLQAIKNGGLLCFTSCSFLLSLSEIDGLLQQAAFKSQRKLRIIKTLGLGSDHPIDPFCLEMRYLKGVIVQVNS